MYKLVLNSWKITWNLVEMHGNCEENKENYVWMDG